MKSVKAKEMARVEKLAYDKGASEERFMNEAGRGVAELVQRYVADLHIEPLIILLCGSGNNAGDAYVAGRILLEGGFHVKALAFAPLEKSSVLCQLQANRFQEKGGVIQNIESAQEIQFKKAQLLIDGILGTGFHGQVEGVLKEAIEKANQSKLPIISVDVPSGINGTTGEVGGVAIEALHTLFLGLPKSGCFLGDVWNYMGRISVFDFGLGKEAIEQAQGDFELIQEALIEKYFPKVQRTRHKYETGYVIGVGGSPGMPGAPILASFSALRAGAGIVRLLHPAGMESELGHAPYEVIRQGYQTPDEILHAMEKASAVFIGPGIGTSTEARSILEAVLPKIDKPCVIDAEALTLLAAKWIDVPPKTIMTPHIGEMKRLLGIEKTESFEQLLTLCHQFSESKKVTLVLKGAPTFIFHPGKTPYISITGDPGMATAGSGDVLTGVIAAFLAQTHDPLKAAILGVHVHGLAGEYAAHSETSYCMVASDITEALPLVFAQYQSTN